MTVIVPLPKEMRITDKFSIKREFSGFLPSDGRVFGSKMAGWQTGFWALDSGCLDSAF